MGSDGATIIRKTLGDGESSIASEIKIKTEFISHYNYKFKKIRDLDNITFDEL